MNERIKARARGNRRAFLRRAGLRACDLDAVTLSMLDVYARGKAQLDLRDEAQAGAGKDYWVSFNAVRRALDSLARRLHDLGLDSGRGNGAGGLAQLAADGRALRESRELDGGKP